MRKKILLSAFALLLGTACVPTFSQKGPLPFSKFAYTSVEGQAWKSDEIVLDGVRKQFSLGTEARIHYVELNPSGGQTIVFVHGLGSYLKFWRYQLDEFADAGFRVIALDMLGYGKSAKPARFPYSMESMAEVVREFLQKKDIQNPVLVGHSMGGHTSLAYAIQYPDEVKALVLTAPAGFEKFSPKEREWFRKIFSVGLVKSVGEPGLWSSIKRNNFYRWNDDYNWLIEERARVRMTAEFDQYAYVNVRSVQGLTHTEFTRNNLGLITAKTLIIYGDKDRLIPNRFMHAGNTADIMKFGHEGIKGSRLVELKNCGHTVQIDCSSEYNREVLRFLSFLVDPS